MRNQQIGIALGLILVLAATARAQEHRCVNCGCCSCLRKVCVVKKIEKEISKACWDVKCEDVCIPGCSELCGEVCKEDKCGCWSYNIWKPGCATCIKTRRIPVKTVVTRKVPSYVWVVEYRCANCCNSGCKTPGDSADPAPGDEDPAPSPAAAASSRAQPAEVAELFPIGPN